MTNIKLTLLAAAAFGAASIGGASALPFSNSTPSVGEGNVELARIVCDRHGRCYDTRRNRPTVYYAPQQSYAYGYNNGYNGYNGYDRGYGRSGVSVGVGSFGLWVR
jgi:hypothetical protein